MYNYQLTGKVIIVSLTEQTLREYDNGQLVGWMYVVTGQEAAQTPPGLWHVQWKKQHMVFKSSEPAGTALWYPPTAINYAMSYHDDGYFLHDATWRSYFGPGANLPHDDYTSGKYSDTGTHGCINMTLDNARDLYNWVDVGIPVVVY
jgi:lipoprotein-anchoring transpeptidase ErfK/SrfK